MSKKVLAVVGLAAAIAVSTGVISFTSNPHPRGTDGDPADVDIPAATQAYDDPDTPDVPDIVGEETDAPEVDATEPPTPDDDADDATAAPAQDSGDDSYGYTDLLTAQSAYHIARVIDHTSGYEVTAREVFGSQYRECFLSFYDDGTFALCLNPVADDVRKGSYLIYGDVISVSYSDGSGAEFDILSDGSGGIHSIVINYGDYDVYFG